MPKVNFGGQSYDCKDKSVLDCLTAQGVAIPSSCHSGICQTCMLRAVGGNVPPKAQEGLKPTLIDQNYFLACSCYPEEDIEVVLPNDALTRVRATVSSIELLAGDIIGIKIQPSQTFDYRAGQFINFYKDETTSRSYSLASVPALNEDIFLHVRKVPDGLVSNWIFNNLQVNDIVSISMAVGNCFYVPGKPEQDILLIGTGSGLAPLYGIARDALYNKHKGKIRLYHGAYNTAGLYLAEELRKLEEANSNFSYIPCISEGPAVNGFAKGMVLDVALADNPDLAGWRVFLCGNPAMVTSAKTQTFLAGAATRDIFADPF
ncbi:MAG: 2Fe-2S iron-sulfur cluster binding domain-containing protein [Sideroxydans sp.]|nr:2Fe-2S iron-sulfur cluster binding domain-containing protein [Sideroxydans sp.]